MAAEIREHERESLLALTEHTLATMIIEGDISNELQKIYNIKDKFTPNEKEEFRGKNKAKRS
ncbi:hypothetical protein RND71_032284 [Anisodus tanguticus]|uniref:SKP1 component dimerisation domain-containing protein n=1 Tax=Anisodus tanguticus TaxID=243964 RepID=A0AAE1RCE1_9SOLA|nr:hypothetical protein RND71_032284 [Anisodus tanguticus]